MTFLIIFGLVLYGMLYVYCLYVPLSKIWRSFQYFMLLVASYSVCWRHNVWNCVSVCLCVLRSFCSPMNKSIQINVLFKSPLLVSLIRKTHQDCISALTFFYVLYLRFFHIFIYLLFIRYIFKCRAAQYIV